MVEEREEKRTKKKRKKMAKKNGGNEDPGSPSIPPTHMQIRGSWKPLAATGKASVPGEASGVHFFFFQSASQLIFTR